MVIELGDDSTRREQLRLKLEEYNKRREYDHPELRRQLIPGVVYRERALAILLEYGQMDTDVLGHHIQAEFGGDFVEDKFDEAMAIVLAYIETGGEGLEGGTGLPAVALAE